MDALQNMADDVTLDGIIEADETFSPSRTRAIIARVRHLLCHAKLISVVILHISEAWSKEKVCVPCAVNRNGLSISKDYEYW